MTTLADLPDSKKPERLPIRAFCVRSQVGLLPCWRQIRATAVRHFRRHADRFPQCGMRVNGFADVDGICAHLYRQGHLTNHVTGVGADHAAAQNLAVAVGLG